jgi:hippurate hydrolase
MTTVRGGADDRPGLDGTSLCSEARDHLTEVIELRRALHQDPELGLHLPRTQTRVLDALSDLDLEITMGDEVSWVVATVVGDGAGPTLLLRGDMDALPMPEDTRLDYASRNDGVMHACGHDAHVAMLVGAARLLDQHRSELRGTVKLLFQPGEEGHHGARHCIEGGVLNAPEVDAAFALHITPNIPSGFLASKPGPLLASADEFMVTVRGRGGHASTPHWAADPIPVAAELVLALQAMVTRTVDVFDPAVLTVGRIQAGTTSNVIPESAELTGTVRAVSEGTRQLVHDGLHRVTRHVAAAHDCEVGIDYSFGYPVTINDGDFVGFAREVLVDLVGPERYIDLNQPIMGAEDWSYVLQRVPGSMAFLGACPDGLSPASAPSNHSNRTQIDEGAMAIGVAAHVAVALSYLS